MLYQMIWASNRGKRGSRERGRLKLPGSWKELAAPELQRICTAAWIEASQFFHVAVPVVALLAGRR